VSLESIRKRLEAATPKKGEASVQHRGMDCPQCALNLRAPADLAALLAVVEAKLAQEAAYVAGDDNAHGEWTARYYAARAELEAMP
jgi:hypothetical protein